jgi:protein O-mannosyl-transferase
MLALAVWAAFGQTLHHGFVNYDDQVYVYENPMVAQGLTVSGIVQAFTRVHASNWHPVTWLSHMLDCQFYGLKAGGHHLTNVLLHAATAILLFLALRRMLNVRPEPSSPPGAVTWRCGFVAAVFAVHPLRVESVAWVAERKDVLSGLFFMLTLWAYARYAQKQSRGEGRGASAKDNIPALGSRLWTLDYALALFFFACGLMSKPMLVTVPLVLLLLDYWPLKRFTIDDLRLTMRPLFLEKLPFIGLALASGVVTLFAQRDALQSFGQISPPLRLENALLSYVGYIGQMFRPSGLAVYYPFLAKDITISGVLLSVLLLSGITAGALVARRSRPWLLTGWLWYLVMLAPVIGLVQVGAQARADRYTYLPQIGLYILVAWGAADLCGVRRRCRAALALIAVAIPVVLLACARRQTAYWQDSVTLWTQTLACTSDNDVAHNNLGLALADQGKVAEAIQHYEFALQIKPDNAKAHYNLGSALARQGKLTEAIQHYEEALRLKPDYADAYNNFGIALAAGGRPVDAIQLFERALQLKPDFAKAHYNLGSVLARQGKWNEAIQHFERAIELKPDYADAHNNLGIALNNQGKVTEAIQHFERAVEFRPDYADACNNLGIALAGQGKTTEAVRQFQQALDLATAQGNTALAEDIRHLLKSYSATSSPSPTP